MDTQQRLDLEDIRKAAQERDQERLQFLLKRLLQGLDYFFALAVPIELIREFLPTFEAYYPEETWVRQLLLMINNYGKAPDNDISEMALHQNFTLPGIGNYLKAIFDLTQAMQDRHTSEARIGFMASAVVNAIMANLAHAWYGKREKAWHTVQQDPQAEQATRIAYIFWTSPHTVARDQELWVAVADSIEQKLSRLERKSQ